MMRCYRLVMRCAADDGGRVTAPADDVTITPHRSQYAVGEVITCSAQGYPVPEVRWSRDADDFTVPESNLTVTDEMIGDGNGWTCTAQNELNVVPASMSVEFTVVSGTCWCVSSLLSVVRAGV